MGLFFCFFNNLNFFCHYILLFFSSYQAEWEKQKKQDVEMEEKLTAEWKEATLLFEDDLDHNNKDVPLEATKAGQKILKKRQKNLTKLATKLDKWKGNDREEKWIELIHHTKRKLHKVKVGAGISKKKNKDIFLMEQMKIKAEKRKRRQERKKREKERKKKLKREQESKAMALQRGKRARALLNADTQMRARMLEREKPWLERQHCINRLSLICTTSISMLAALIALLMSAIHINFRFPYSEMHACGNDRNVWLTDCNQIQVVSKLPFRCCEANIPLPPENIALRLTYLKFDPTGFVQSCGDSVLHDTVAPVEQNRTRVRTCASVTSPHACALTLADGSLQSEGTLDYCTWYFGFKDGSCNSEIQHRSCEMIETEVECALNSACRPNKDPWYMDAIIDGNPVSVPGGIKKLEYVGKCVMEGEPRNITATTCGMSQNDYCGDGTGPGTKYFDHTAYQTFEMTTSVGVMALVSPLVLFFRGVRVLEMEPMRKLGINMVLLFGVLISGTLSALPFWLARDMKSTCDFYRQPTTEPIADGLNRACQSEVCAMAKQAYIDEVCRLGDNILETLIMCSIASGMSVFAAFVAHHGGNEDQGFDFQHVGKDNHLEEEEQLLSEAKELDAHEHKHKSRKKRIADAKKHISETEKEKKKRKAREKKARKRKEARDKAHKKKMGRKKKIIDARESMRKKHREKVRRACGCLM